jgi:hypothetical protein
VEGPEPRHAYADKQNFREAGGHRSFYFVGQIYQSAQFESVLGACAAVSAHFRPETRIIKRLKMLMT